jgi:hypothetical protein
MRHYGAARVSLRDVAKVRQTFGVTINDVALAAIADGSRACNASWPPIGSHRSEPHVQAVTRGRSRCYWLVVVR